MIDHSKLRHIVKNIQNKKILVLGDIMLDQYIYGSVDRISPEAPIPIININNTKASIGGAGNVLNNLRFENNLPPIEIIVVPMSLAKDGVRISTTRIKNSEIDSNGNLLAID